MSEVSHKAGRPRKQARLDYVQMDVDCLDKPRFQTFLDSINPIAGLFIIKLWLAIGAREKALLPRKYAISLCHSVRCPKEIAEEAIELALAEGLLEATEECLTLGRIADAQEELAEKRETWRNSKNIPTDSPSVFPEYSNENIDGKREDSNNTLNLSLSLKPSSLVPDLRAARLPDVLKPHSALWEAWEMRCKANGRPLDDIYREQIWCPYISRPDDFRRDLEHTLSRTKAFNIIPAPTPERAAARSFRDFDDERRQQRKKNLNDWLAKEEANDKKRADKTT